MPDDGPSSMFIAANRSSSHPLVIVGHGSGAAFLERQAGWFVERLDLALFVDATMTAAPAIQLQLTMSRNLPTNAVLESLNCRTRCG